MKFLLFLILLFLVLFFSVKKDFSEEKIYTSDNIQYNNGWLKILDLPFGVINHITKTWTSQGEQYIIIAGGRINNTVTNLVTMIRLSPYVIISLPTLPFPTENAGGFIVKDSLYVIGGTSGSISNCRKTVYKINLNNPSGWQQKNDMPNSVSGITFSSAAVNDSVVFVGGGRDAEGKESNQFLLYNPKNDTWTEISKMPYKAWGASLGIVNDSTIIIVGGVKNDHTVYKKMIKGQKRKGSWDKINWVNLSDYPPGPVYNLGCWGTKRGIVFFSGGSGISPDTIYANTMAYFEGTENTALVAIRPTPVTNTQLDGFINISGSDTVYSLLSAGGSTAPYPFSSTPGLGFNSVESISFGSEFFNTTRIKSENIIPTKLFLYQNYPNPFNPETKIKFDIPGIFQQNVLNVRLIIYDVHGKEIATLINKELRPGSYEITFNGKSLSSGIYYYKLTAVDFSEIRKMVLIK